MGNWGSILLNHLGKHVGHASELSHPGTKEAGRFTHNLEPSSLVETAPEGVGLLVLVVWSMCQPAKSVPACTRG